MSDLKEFVITLHRKEDLEEFYKDMEILRPTPYNCMPERTVDCANRRPISRNTHYWMTEEEAEQLRKDPRILAVELTPKELGLVVKPMYEQTSTTWTKNTTVNNQHKNWGLLRCVEGQQRTNWGSNGTVSQTGTIRVNAEGRNVDVVIVDGMLNPGHPEFNEDPDGLSGNTRVIQYNWFQHNATVWPGNPSNTYVYTPYAGTSAEADNNHGMHVAGTAVGNTQGWARAANIYNINPYSTDVNGLDALYLFDYIREFHRNKFVGRTYAITNSGSSSYLVDGSGTNPTINLRRGLTYTLNINSSGHPFWIKTQQVTGTGSAYNTGVTNNGTAVGTITFQVPLDAPDTLYYICQFHGSMTGVFNITGTGKENPTICNHSWGYQYQIPFSAIANVFWRGSFTNDAPYNASKLLAYGIYGFLNTAFVPARYPALDADIADAIEDGIIQVGAAANDYTKIDVLGGIDYNNYISDGIFQYFCHRGSSPAAADGFICVGSINLLVAENKSDFSNTGPRVDIYAPGASIISSVHTGGTTDPRSGSWRLNKLSGTSMASPQVCGALACALEIYPRMTQAEAKEYILNYSKTGQITDTGGGYNDFTSLQGSSNRYLFYYKERNDSGNTWPKMNYSLRTKSKFSYPRNQIRRTA